MTQFVTHINETVPEVEYIGKGKAQQPSELGINVSLALIEKQGLIIDPQAFPGSACDDHTPAEQLKQTSILLQRGILTALCSRGGQRHA
ncbi:hypothetical protein [Trinickia mobilis]|uniref:hypothetical protein n=1 Tax=Trinickia mobilis TaxID=2816356 RepID=UPI001A90813A|nr:hypothetical protein [Trinickia mobilis]